jgi:hypothetical protein
VITGGHSRTLALPERRLGLGATGEAAHLRACRATPLEAIAIGPERRRPAPFILSLNTWPCWITTNDLLDWVRIEESDQGHLFCTEAVSRVIS